MKKLIRSFVLALGGLFITATASDAASISFTPTGAPLDSDLIFDIITVPGQVIDFQILFDTNNINTSLLNSVEIDFSIKLDPTELELVSLPQGTTAIPNGFTTNKNAFAGIPQNRTGTLTTFQAKVLNGLISDGMSDMSLKLNFANIGGPTGQDVSSSFGGSGVKQIVEVQPVPEPTTIFGSALALSVGGWLKRKKSGQENKTTPQN